MEGMCRGKEYGSAVHITLLLDVSLVAMAHLNKKFVKIL